MQSEEARLRYLFQPYFIKKASQTERKKLAELTSHEQYRHLFMQLVSETWENYQNDGNWISATTSAAMLKQILAKRRFFSIRKKKQHA